jgi:hypothetical protein
MYDRYGLFSLVTISLATIPDASAVGIPLSSSADTNSFALAIASNFFSLDSPSLFIEV